LKSDWPAALIQASRRIRPATMYGSSPGASRCCLPVGLVSIEPEQELSPFQFYAALEKFNPKVKKFVLALLSILNSQLGCLTNRWGQFA
jgi:hypothetical protein